MNLNFFRAYGVVAWVLTPLVCTSAIDEYAPLTLMQTLRIVFLFAMTIMVGFGLIYLRKWAALYFSLPLFVYGICQAYFSIEEVTFPFNLLWMLHGVSLMLPLVVTIRIWKNLTWGKGIF